MSDDNSVVSVDRRYLLFQVDLSKSTVSGQFAGLTASTKSPGAFRITDPVDYDDPAHPLYWRNVNNQDYQKTFNEDLKAFQTAFINDVNSGSIVLRSSNSGLPYRDITDAITSVSNYQVSLVEFQNNLTLVLGQDQTQSTGRSLMNGETLDNVSQADRQALVQDILNSDVGENDVIMVRSSHTKDSAGNFTNYFIEYIGFVGQVVKNISYGTVKTLTLSVFGISKQLELSNMISQKSLSPNEFGNITGPSQNQAYVLATAFNGKSLKQIFTDIVSQVLYWTVSDNPIPTPADSPDSLGAAQSGIAQKAATGVPALDSIGQTHTPTRAGSTTNNNPNATLFDIDFGVFLAKNPSLQFNIFVVLTLYLMKITNVNTSNNVTLQNLFPKFDTSTGTSPVLDKDVMGILEHGDHQVYNLAVAHGFSNFFSQFQTAADVLGEVRSTTYYDVFEAKDGTLIVRPPRYNKIEISLSEYERVNLTETNFTLESPSSIEGVLKYKSDPKSGFNGFVFNENADFFIGQEIIAESTDVIRQDMTLETTAQTKFTMPLVGPQDFPAGVYTDPALLIKYGLRSKGPVDNPNVTNASLAKLYAPIVIQLLNSRTRTTDAVVRDSQKFRVGKLYVIDDPYQPLVAYLISEGLEYTYGRLTNRSLGFTMARAVENRKILDILVPGNDNEILNFALMYLKDPVELSQPSTAGPGFQNESLSVGVDTMKKNLIDKGRKVLNSMLDYAQQIPGGQDATVPMFKYVPSILDLIVELEQSPNLSNTDSSSDPKIPQTGKTGRQDSSIQALTDPQGGLYAFSLPPGHTPTTASFPWAVGASGYGDSLNEAPQGDSAVGAMDGGSSKGTVIPVRLTPFNTRSLARDPNTFKLAQPLIDKMAALDLAMKFEKNNPFHEGTFPNFDGIPQLYKLDPTTGDYLLFGTNDFANSAIQNNSWTFELYSRLVQTPARSYPGAMYLQNGAWDGPLFSLTSVGSNTFNLPAGHIGVPLPGGNIEFYELSGGRYVVDVQSGVASGIATLSIKGLSGATVFKASPSTTAQTKPTSAKDAVKAVATLASASASFDNSKLPFLISPYMEPTVERLLESDSLGGDHSVIGYRTSADSSAVKAAAQGKSPAFLLLENDGHSRGWSVDLSASGLVAQSASDLIPKDETTARIMLYARKVGFGAVPDPPAPPSGPRKDQCIVRIRGAFSAEMTYFDGTPYRNNPLSFDQYVHLGLSTNEVQLATTRLAKQKQDYNLSKANKPKELSVLQAALAGV